MTWWKKLLFLRNRGQFDADLAEEMRLHIEERAAELSRAGLTPTEALRRARAEFGSPTSLRERTRLEWQFSWIEDLRSDLRYGARTLAASPAFFFSAVLSLALGVGANTTLFSLTTEFLFAEPSVNNSRSLWRVRVGGNSHVGIAQLRFLQEAKLFPGVAGMREDGEVNWRINGETRPLQAMRVSDNLFSMAGIPVALGRGILPGDEDTVVISDAMWRSKLAADPTVVGRVLEIDGRPHRIAGVLPPDHRSVAGFGLSADIYAPVRATGSSVMLFVRGPEGADRSAILERLQFGARRMDEAMPERDLKWADENVVEGMAGIDRFKSRSMQGVGGFFAMLMIVGGLLLLIACINVSNLVLARGSARVQEFAVRASLGAGRGRIVRQLLTETLLLTAAGTMAGLVINYFLTRAMNHVQLDLPVLIVLHMAPDWRLAAYASLLAAGTALVVGLLPAIRISRGELHGAMKNPIAGRMTLRRVLVVAQVAVSIVVLTAAVLFARNLLASVAAEPGFDLDRTMFVRVRLVPDSYKSVEAKASMAERIERELESAQGVVSVSATRLIPFNDDSTRGGARRRDDGENIVIRHHSNRIGPRYFATIGVPVVAGREFTANEPENSIIVNESFARNFFGQGSAIGRTVDKQTVVGVVRDSKYAYLNDHMRPAMFEPYRTRLGEGRESALIWMVRTAGDPAALVNGLRARVGELDRSAAVEIRPMRNALGIALMPSQVAGALLGGMGVLGLLLTAVGVYGVLAFSVARRIREIGLRVALGAGPASVMRLVLRECGLLLGIGLGIGLLIAFFVTRPLSTFLVPDISTNDPVTYLAVVLLIAAAGTAASIGPARRALRVDPMVALRYE